MDKPPDFSKAKIDMSRFHDLMHRPFTAHCRSMYGGPRHHLSLWWEYIGSSWVASRTRCRIGWHRWCDSWTQNLGDSWTCGDCYAQREK